MRILIVEDDPVIALDLTDSLARGGHEVVGPATSAAEAVALCEAERPKLALVDINLRDGDNGVILARGLVARWGLTVIFVSAQREQARRARDIAFGYIGKAFEAGTALRSVEAARVVLDGGTLTSVPAGLELF